MSKIIDVKSIFSNSDERRSRNKNKIERKIKTKMKSILNITLYNNQHDDLISTKLCISILCDGSLLEKLLWRLDL